MITTFVYLRLKKQAKYIFNKPAGDYSFVLQNAMQDLEM